MRQGGQHAAAVIQIDGHGPHAVIQPGIGKHADGPLAVGHRRLLLVVGTDDDGGAGGPGAGIAQHRLGKDMTRAAGGLFVQHQNAGILPAQGLPVTDLTTVNSGDLRQAQMPHPGEINGLGHHHRHRITGHGDDLHPPRQRPGLLRSQFAGRHAEAGRTCTHASYPDTGTATGHGQQETGMLTAIDFRSLRRDG